MTSGQKIAANRRLKQAVRRNRTFSTQGMLELLFTLAFKGLVYPQIWEDPEVDMEALAITPDCHVATIASGSCNVHGRPLQSGDRRAVSARSTAAL